MAPLQLHLVRIPGLFVVSLLVSHNRCSFVSSLNTAPAAAAAPEAVPSDPTAYYNDFWAYSTYYGEAAARQFYGAWSPPEGTPPPPGVVVASPEAAAAALAAAGATGADAGTAASTSGASAQSAQADSTTATGAASAADSSGASASAGAAEEVDPAAAATAWEEYKKQVRQMYRYTFLLFIHGRHRNCRAWSLISHTFKRVDSCYSTRSGTKNSAKPPGPTLIPQSSRRLRSGS
jgi:hypothetical protein